MPCSHVSGMKIRFLTLIEELRRAGDDVRAFCSWPVISCPYEASSNCHDMLIMLPGLDLA